MRVGADCDIPAAQLAETPYERFVGQGSSDRLEQPRNIDFEGFFVLYKYTRLVCIEEYPGILMSCIHVSLHHISMELSLRHKASKE